MKKTQYLLGVTIVLFLIITPLFAQNSAPQTELNDIIHVDLAIPEGLGNNIKGKPFIDDSFSWMSRWMPDFDESSFENIEWIKVNKGFKVGIKLPTSTVIQLRVFHITGKLIEEEFHELDKGIHRFPLEATDWELGKYIIQIETEWGSILKKVMKSS